MCSAGFRYTRSMWVGLPHPHHFKIYIAQVKVRIIFSASASGGSNYLYTALRSELLHAAKVAGRCSHAEHAGNLFPVARHLVLYACASRVAPPEHLPAHVSAELVPRAHAYGLQTADDASRLWGVTGCQPDQASAATALNVPLWQIMGAVSAARCKSDLRQTCSQKKAPTCSLHMSLQGLVIHML